MRNADLGVEAVRVQQVDQRVDVCGRHEGQDALVVAHQARHDLISQYDPKRRSPSCFV